MGLFSEWLKKEQGIEDPVGLEAAKKRVVGIDERSISIRDISFIREEIITPDHKGDFSLPFDEAKGLIRGNARKANQLRERLQDPAFQERFTGMMRERQKLDEKSSAIDRNVTDVESGRRFLSGLFSQNSRGGLSPHPRPTNVDTNMAMNMKPHGVPFTREYRGLDLGQILSMRENPKLLEALKNGDIQGLQRLNLRNKILTNGPDGKPIDNSWQVARQLFEHDLDNKGRDQMRDLGLPIPTGRLGGAFDPQIPVRYQLDQEGNYTGLTNIDQMALPGQDFDMEEYNRHFGDLGYMRGIHMLQKLLLSGGRDILTAKDEYMLPLISTIDHMFGRSENENPKGFESLRKESPLSTALTLTNVNQAKQKVGDHLQGMGSHTALNNDDLAKYILYRADSTQWDKILEQDEKNASVLDEDGEEGPKQMGLPVDPMEILGFDSKQAKAIASDWSNSNQNGLDIRNLTKLPPEPTEKKEQGRIVRRNEVDFNDNSWSGGRGYSYYKELEPFRKSIAAALHSNPDFHQIRSNFLNRMGLSEEELEELAPTKRSKIEKEIRNATRQYISDGYNDRVRGMSTLYGMGRLSNDNFIDELKSVTDKLYDTVPDEENRDILKQVRDDNFNSWGSKLNQWFDTTRPGSDGLFPVPRTKDALELGSQISTTAHRALSKLNGETLENYLTKQERELLKELGF